MTDCGIVEMDARKVGMKVAIGLSRINDKEETAEFDTCFYMHWIDTSLKADKSKAVKAQIRKRKTATGATFIPGNQGSNEDETNGAESAVDYDRIRLDDESKPNVTFYNSGSHDRIDEEVFVDRTTGTVLWFCNYLVTVWAFDLELRSFPYDRQVLEVVASIDDCIIEKWSLESENIPDDFEGRKNVHLYTAANGWVLDRTSTTATETGKATYFRAKFSITRQPQYYLWTIVFVTFLIGLFNLVIVGIDQTKLDSRVTITLTLMLTTVAFKFVTMNFVPPTSYQTRLDWYTTSSFIFIGLSMSESFIVSKVASARYVFFCIETCNSVRLLFF